jgi:hypothetical protein
MAAPGGPLRALEAVPATAGLRRWFTLWLEGWFEGSETKARRLADRKANDGSRVNKVKWSDLECRKVGCYERRLVFAARADCGRVLGQKRTRRRRRPSRWLGR